MTSFNNTAFTTYSSYTLSYRSALFHEALEYSVSNSFHGSVNGIISAPVLEMKSSVSCVLRRQVRLSRYEDAVLSF